MRPPQFAGESVTHPARWQVTRLASMRPPQFAGESKSPPSWAAQVASAASMRPPQFAGESETVLPKGQQQTLPLQ